MGYSPWGHKELDRTEVTQHARTGFDSLGRELDPTCCN